MEESANQSGVHWIKKIPVVPILFFVGAFLTYRYLNGKSSGTNGSLLSGGENGSAIASSAYFKTPFKNESEFIVHAITTDITEMASYAKNHTAPATNASLATVAEDSASTEATPIYNVTINLSKTPLKCQVKIDTAKVSIWSPEPYAGLAGEIFNALDLKTVATSPAKAPDVSLLYALTAFTPGVIETENQSLSAALEKDFSNPLRHEQAALLLGTFTLRDTSGHFFDIRSPLCRMTSHLAMADALSKHSARGIDGKVAEALLYTLMNNEKPALERIATIDKTQPALAAWSRALTVRNNHDYRLLASPTNRTALESIQYFRAYRFGANPDLAWEQLTETEMIGSADRSRIVNEHPYSVGLGHVMLKVCLPLDIKEVGTVYQMSHGHALRTQAELVAALNEMPDRCVGMNTNGKPAVHIIGWGQWAMFEQRHLCQALVSDYHFMAEVWGVREEARDFSEKIDPMFSKLLLYPFVRKITARDERSYHAAVDAANAVTRTTPQIVSSGIWNKLLDPTPVAATYTPDGLKHVCEWHTHNPPPGTSYDPYPRFAHGNLVDGPGSTERIQRMYDLSPYDSDIQYSLMIGKFGNKATYEQTEPLFHPVLDYESDQLYFLAERTLDNPARYEATMSKAGAIDPVYYYHLADYLVRKNRQADAVPYIQKGMAKCLDRVWMASEASTMVKYYLKNGQTNRAAKIADDAGAVYSMAGLEAKAEFLEATGKYLDALDYYKKIEERYESSGELVKFCERYKAKTGRTDLDETAARRTRRAFPNGMEQVALKDFSSTTRDGMVVGAENGATRDAGIHKGDVIVALNGIRVHSKEQYLFVRSLDSKPELDLIVCKGGLYREIKASPPGRSFGVSFQDYTSSYASN